MHAPQKKQPFKEIPLSHREIKDLRKRPIAGVTFLMRLLTNYDNALEETERVRMLSARHYQHHANSVQKCRDMKKKLEDAQSQMQELERLVKAAEESRCFMIDSAAKSDTEKKKIIEYINALPGKDIYDGIAGRNDVVCSLSRKKFDEMLLALEEE